MLQSNPSLAEKNQHVEYYMLKRRSSDMKQCEKEKSILKTNFED